MGGHPRISEGDAVDAIRSAEAALAHQNIDAAQVDLQVVTAVLNAHAANDAGLAELTALQHDVETAVGVRPDLDTPAGAREFQRYLIGKLRDIRNVVDTCGLDATSKATLAAALATLYASATPDPQERGLAENGPSEVEPGPLDAAAPSLPVDAAAGPATVPTASTAPAPSAPASAAPLSPWTGGFPGGGSLGGGMPTMGGSMGAPPSLTDWPKVELPERFRGDELGANPGDEPSTHPDSDLPPDEGVGTDVDLPDGDIVTAPSPEVAAAITAAVSGTPIPEAFRLQGISLPAPGSPISVPLEPAQLGPGDIGVFADRHALALGNGKAFLDARIQPIASVTGPGFLGWQHPPPPQPANATLDVPAPNRAAVTAPS